MDDDIANQAKDGMLLRSQRCLSPMVCTLLQCTVNSASFNSVGIDQHLKSVLLDCVVTAIAGTFYIVMKPSSIVSEDCTFK